MSQGNKTQKYELLPYVEQKILQIVRIQFSSYEKNVIKRNKT